MAVPLRMGTRGKQLFRVAIKCKWSKRATERKENQKMKNEEKQLNAKQQQSLGKENKQINLVAAIATRRKASAPMGQLSLIEIKLKPVGPSSQWAECCLVGGVRLANRIETTKPIRKSTAKVIECV